MTTWRVLTWNLHGAGRPNLDVIAEVVLSYRADVIALQEVQHRQVRALARRLQWRAFWSRKHYPYTPVVWWRAEGLALLSPFTMVEPVAATVSPGVSTWTYRHRIAVAATVVKGHDRLRVGNVHLDTASVDARIAQAGRAAAIVGATRPAAIAGDLNATNDTEVLRAFRSLGVVDAGGGDTSPAHAPARRLDFVLVPGDATVMSSLTPPGGDHWAQLSDHLPVVVEFTLPSAS